MTTTERAVPPSFDPAADPDDHDGRLRPGLGRDRDATSPFMGGEVTLRWIYGHNDRRVRRHAGHAALIRERIDGATGV
jgi:hypothetical protein